MRNRNEYVRFTYPTTRAVRRTWNATPLMQLIAVCIIVLTGVSL